MSAYTVDGFDVVTNHDDAQPHTHYGVEVFELRGRLVAAPDVEVTILWTVTNPSADDWSNACDWDKPYLSATDYRLACSAVGLRA